MIETSISAKAVCLDCREEIEGGQVSISADPEDHKMGVDVFFANGQLVENCKAHHDKHRWGKKKPQHADYLIEENDETLVGTITVSTEGKKFAINSLNTKIRSVLLGK